MPRKLPATPDAARGADATHAAHAAAVALAALPNLGPVSARWLVAAGITSPAILRTRGAVAVFRQVAMHRAGDVSFNLLYALEGAIRGVRWDKLPRADRDALRAAANAPVSKRDDG
jgi:DNA transformation protein